MKDKYRKKRFAAVILLLLIACTGCAASDTGKRAAVQHSVAIVGKSTESQFFKSVYAGAMAAATEYNMQLSIMAPDTEEDWKTQNRMAEQAVKDGADALLFSAIDFENNTPAVEAAVAAGVHVAAIDSAVNTDKISTYIGTDNYGAGCMAAQGVLQSGLGQMTVGLVNFDVNSANGQSRERGVRETLKGVPGVTILDTVSAVASPERAQASTAELLMEHPEINVIIAFNEPTTVGAARAVQELGRADDLWMVGFDNNAETVDRLQTGAVDALIVQNPYAMGYLGVESAAKLIGGKQNEVSRNMDTSTVLITRENMFSEENQQMLFPFD